MDTKAVDLSMDKIFQFLGQTAMKPETLIAFGLLAFFVVVLVNWIVSITVVLMKPILCFVIMAIFIKPELAQAYIAEDSAIKVIKITQTILSSASASLAAIIKKICEHFTTQ